MGTFETILLILLVANAIALATLVLLQQGKGADIGAAFGSGGANTVFGAAGGASFLMKLTVWLSIGFFVITFGLAYAAQGTRGEPAGRWHAHLAGHGAGGSGGGGRRDGRAAVDRGTGTGRFGHPRRVMGRVPTGRAGTHTPKW